MLARTVVRKCIDCAQCRARHLPGQYAAFHVSTRSAVKAKQPVDPYAAPTTRTSNTRVIYGSKSTTELFDEQLSVDALRNAGKSTQKTIAGLKDGSIRREELDTESALPYEDPQYMAQVLNKAHQAGVLEMSVPLVQGFLQALQERDDAFTANDLRNICARFHTSIDSAYTLARLLVRSAGAFDQAVGRQILLRASELGSAKATIHIVKSALQTDQLRKKEVQPSLERLRRLVSSEPPIVPALVVRGKILEAEQEYAAAEELYTRVLETQSVRVEPSTLERYAKRWKERYEEIDDGGLQEKKITVDENDPELDHVAARLGLAKIKYTDPIRMDDAVKDWTIAALEHDDPMAYYELARHTEWEARGQHRDKADKDDPLGHHWLRFVPYKWYEYMMKAAVSQHVEACYNIAMFYMLDWMGYAHEVEDPRLRRLLTENPLTTVAAPLLLKLFGQEVDMEARKRDLILRWLACAMVSGHRRAQIVQCLLHLDYGTNKGDKYMADLLWTAARGRSMKTYFEDHSTDKSEQLMAQQVYKWLMKDERNRAIVQAARTSKERSKDQQDISDCWRKLPRDLQLLSS